MGEEEDAQAAQPRTFTSPLQQQLYLQTRLGAPVFSPKFRKPQVAGQGVRAALPQLEKSFLAQKTQQLRSSLQAAIQVPSLRQDLPGPGFPNAELPPLEHKPPGIATVPLRGSGAKLSRAAERPPLLPGGLDTSQRVAPIKSAAQVLGPASELPYVKLIYTLREYPNTEDFVYLRRMDRNPSQYDPYALEVVPFASLHQQDFYTMSVRGITHYVDGQTLDFA
ncbi:DHC3 protein, partial [Haematococcus lacustris]